MNGHMDVYKWIMHMERCNNIMDLVIRGDWCALEKLLLLALLLEMPP